MVLRPFTRDDRSQYATMVHRAFNSGQGRGLTGRSMGTTGIYIVEDEALIVMGISDRLT